jgi:hypothetical protein
VRARWPETHGESSWLLSSSFACIPCDCWQCFQQRFQKTTPVARQQFRARGTFHLLRGCAHEQPTGNIINVFRVIIGWWKRFDSLRSIVSNGHGIL